MTNPKKQKEWYGWGKDAYKNRSRMMKNNSHHPDYDTKEKREAIHDKYDDWKPAPERLKVQFKYDDEDIAEVEKQYKAGYDGSRKWYAKADAKYQKVLDKYAPIFNTANELAAAVDVSDIKDGFPCGSAHLYLQRYPEAEDLYEALGHFHNDSSTEAYKRKLPIKYQNSHQCIAFDERICEKVNAFLRTKGVFASVYSWID